jgi:glycosyltransferase involved in cell wall biosynthesis
MKMCEAFAHAGAAVRLAVPTRKNPSFAGIDPFEYFGVEKNFTIERLRTPDPVWLIPFGGGAYTKVQGLWFSFSVRRFIKTPSTGGFDVFYTRDEYLLPWLLRLGKRVVWEAHTLPSRAPAYVKYWERCEKIIAITHALRDDLIGLGVAGERIVVAPDGVDLKHFTNRSMDNAQAERIELRKQLGLPHDKFIAMYTGHLYAWKGAQTLADATTFLSEDTEAVFVGGTVLDLREFKEKNKMNTRVYMAGYVAPGRVPHYLRAADVLILPNAATSAVSQKYTSPMKLFEYMASGVPLIASKTPSLMEILNEKNAVFFSSGDAQGLAACILRVKAHADEAHKRAVQALQDVQQYTWQKRAQHIISSLA